jgi:hypothetical protein
MGIREEAIYRGYVEAKMEPRSAVEGTSRANVTAGKRTPKLPEFETMLAARSAKCYEQ